MTILYIKSPSLQARGFFNVYGSAKVKVESTLNGTIGSFESPSHRRLMLTGR